MSEKFNNVIGPQIRRKKKERKTLLLFIALLSLVGSLQASTQYFAYLFGYAPELGRNIEGLYLPWQILVWAAQWNDYYQQEFMKSFSAGLVAMTFGLLVIAIVKLKGQSQVNIYLHGSARWANKDDIEDAGLLSKPNKDKLSMSVFVGAWQDKSGKTHYLTHSGPEHILCYAPTRSGKGVGLVIPTLLTWEKSAVITDLKGELWALTSGWRKAEAHNSVLRFEPASRNSIKWNPLDEIRLDSEYEVGDVQNLATLIVDPDGKGLESHWQKTAQALLVGLILHALYKADQDKTSATLSSIDRMLSDPDRDIKDLWVEMVAFPHKEGHNHEVVSSAARDMQDRPAEEAGSVLSTAKSYLSLYRDPIVAANTRQSEFKIKDLMHHENPVSLYIVTQPNDKSRLRPLIRVLLNMIVRLLADKMDFENGMPKAHYTHKLLLMLDEFPSLGRLEILQESLAFVAGYGMKFYIICQDISQLKSRETGYGQEESITSNCHIQTAYPPNRVETADHLSKLTGQTTVVKTQVTKSGQGFLSGSTSRTEQEVQRALLTTDECLRMPGPKKNQDGLITEAGDMVIYVAGFPAIYGRQPLYFKDPVLKKRASLAAPNTTDHMLYVSAKQPIQVTLNENS